MGTGLHRNRAHRAATLRRSITGVDVHMTGPQAARTVVGVTVTVDRCPTGEALEILGGADEATGHLPTVLERPAIGDAASRGWGALTTVVRNAQ